MVAEHYRRAEFGFPKTGLVAEHCSKVECGFSKTELVAEHYRKAVREEGGLQGLFRSLDSPF